MSTEFGAFKSGLEAVKQGRYSEAIHLLENFCQICQVGSQTNSQEYLHAQMGLVKAYHCIGEHEQARVLCQQLAASKHPQVQAWAQRVLPSLSASGESSPPPQTQVPATQDLAEKSPLTPDEAALLLTKGNKALKFQRYAEAVEVLEEFCQRSSASEKDYYQAQMWLVKAYKGNGQLENAIALCQQLTSSEQEVTQIWARQFLPTLLPQDVAPPPVSPESSTATQTVTATTQEQPLFIIKTLGEFKTFCQQNLLSDFKDIEETRKQVLKSIIFVGVTLLIIVLFLIIIFPTKYIFFSLVRTSNPPLLIIFLFLLGFLSCFWLFVAFYTSATETYANGFKSKIIQKIFEFINTEQKLSYSSYSSDADTDYTISAFINSQLFQTLLKPNKIRQNDCISGKLGETYIFFSEISAEVEVQHPWAKYLNFTTQMRSLNSGMIPRFIARRIFVMMLPIYIIGLLIKFIKGAPYVTSRILGGQKIDYKHFEEEVLKNEVSRQTVFKGLFFRANFNKSLQGKTVVLPRILDTNIHALKKGQGKLIKLEDPEFAKFFTVYGDDQVEARYILSTNLMTKLVKFRKKARRSIYVSFVDNMIYIAIEYAEDVFEPKLFKSMLSFAPIREYFENIQMMLLIVEDLNLNRRIWKISEQL